MCVFLMALGNVSFKSQGLVCSIGFAFIEFEDPRDAEDAVRDMDGRYVCGVRIRVELAKNSSRSVYGG